MIPVTPATKTALQQAVKQIRARITWQDGESVTHEITSEDALISLKKEAEGYYCKSTLRKITIVLAGTTTEILDKRITATVQVKTGADTWGDISWGSFTITEAKVDQEKGTSTFTGYGGIAIMQNQLYQPGSLTFPTTVAALATQLAGLFGIEISTDMTTLPNYNAPIQQDLWAKINGTTCRDILEEIAGATGTIAVIGGGDDTLEFKLPPISEASETLTEDNLITSKVGENWGAVNTVVLSRQPQNDNVEVSDAAPGGKNLFNKNDYGELRAYFKSPAGKLQSSSSDRTIYIPCKPNTTYTIQKGALGTEANNRFRIGTSATEPRINDVLSDTLYLPDTPVQLSATITTGANANYLVAFVYKQNETVSWSDMLDTIMIEEGDTPSPYEPYVPANRVELVISNNQILDKQRETTAEPILNAVKGWQYRNGEIKTEGHAYHEIGDRIDVDINGTEHTLVVTKSTIMIDGGINETLTSTTPETVPINYAKSGGITKTIFNTELAVDKQEQRIDSIVSRQDQTDAAVQEQFTQVTQNLTTIVATVQATGGGNIIKNSVGYGKAADGTLTVWDYGTGADTSTVRSQSSPASLNAGAVSGYEIMISGASEISQPVSLTPGEKYTLALIAKKDLTGTVTITVGNSSESETITLEDETAYNWEQIDVEFTPTIGANTVTITAGAGATAEITDLILTTGGAYTWRQASGEIYNTQVSLDQDGVQVRSSVYSGDYVEITPLEFAGYSNAGGSVTKVFSLNRDTTEVEKLEARSQIAMPPIKIVPIDNASYQGWAFVKEA